MLRKSTYLSVMLISLGVITPTFGSSMKEEVQSSKSMKKYVVLDEKGQVTSNSHSEIRYREENTRYKKVVAPSLDEKGLLLGSTVVMSPVIYTLLASSAEVTESFSPGILGFASVVFSTGLVSALYEGVIKFKRNLLGQEVYDEVIDERDYQTHSKVESELYTMAIEDRISNDPKWVIRRLSSALKINYDKVEEVLEERRSSSFTVDLNHELLQGLAGNIILKTSASYDKANEKLAVQLLTGGLSYTEKREGCIKCIKETLYLNQEQAEEIYERYKFVKEEAIFKKIDMNRVTTQFLNFENYDLNFNFQKTFKPAF
jgi:hypothetical protein